MGTRGVRCIGCNVGDMIWCRSCQKSAVRLEPPICRRCGYPSERNLCKWCRYETPWFDGARSWARYSGGLRTALLHLKACENIHLASALALHLTEVLSASWRIDLVVPVPLSAIRLHMRGFNQVELLAEAFTQLVRLPIEIRALVRIRDTQFQRMLSRVDRERNLRHAFVADNKSFVGMRTLVVDDIFVTGATINSASRAIKKAGGHSVFAITVARSLLNTPA